jgi:hypothetical protein
MISSLLPSLSPSVGVVNVCLGSRVPKELISIVLFSFTLTLVEEQAIRDICYTILHNATWNLFLGTPIQEVFGAW